MDIMGANGLLAASLFGITLPASLAPWTPVLVVAIGGVLLLAVLAVLFAGLLVIHSRARPDPTP